MWEYNHTNTDELCHYGVLGMKWGIRKSRFPTSASSGKTSKSSTKKTGFFESRTQAKVKETRAKAAAKARAAKQAKAKAKSELPEYKRMNDDEIRKAVQRLTLEKQYRELTKKPQSKGKYVVDKFKNKLIDDMVDIANQEAKKAIQKYVTNLISKDNQK